VDLSPGGLCDSLDDQRAPERTLRLSQSQRKRAPANASRRSSRSSKRTSRHRRSVADDASPSTTVRRKSRLSRARNARSWSSVCARSAPGGSRTGAGMP